MLRQRAFFKKKVQPLLFNSAGIFPLLIFFLSLREEKVPVRTHGRTPEQQSINWCILFRASS